jgi:hypothetical protein
MIALSSAASSDGLTWSRMPRSRGYELRLNGEVVGTLRKPGFWSSTFTAETLDGRWMFCRSGFLGTGASIVDAGSLQPVARFQSCWSLSGTLTFADGQAFRLISKGWIRPVWSVIAEGGRLLVRAHKREKTVDLVPGAQVAESRLALLTLFVWYRVLQTEEDSSAAVLVAATS